MRQIFRLSLSIAFLSNVAQSALRLRKADEVQVQYANTGSAQFSMAATATLQNMSLQVGQFEQMVAQHSQHFQAILQGLEKENEAVQAFSNSVAVSNQKLDADNHVLDQEAQTLIGSNNQLKAQLQVYEQKLRIAQTMATVMGGFHADDASSDEQTREVLNDDGSLGTSFLVINTKTTLSGGVHDLAMAEQDVISKLQRSGEEAFAQAKKHHNDLLEVQRQVNGTHIALEQKKARLIAMVQRLTLSHTHLQARAQNLATLFTKLAATASGKTAQSKALLQTADAVKALKESDDLS